MLPKSHRLCSLECFSAVARGGRYFSAGTVGIKFKKNNESRTRIGFSVGLKFSPKAVERNAAKRKLRAAAAQIRPCLKINVDIVIMPRHMPVGIKGSDVKKDLLEALKKGGLISGK